MEHVSSGCAARKSTRCLLPLQAFMYLLRTAEAVPDMRSMDVRIVHKLCLTLSEQVCLGSRHLVNPYKHCFYNTEQLLFEKIAAQPLQKVKSLIAEHFSAENNKSRYFSSLLNSCDFISQTTHQTKGRMIMIKPPDACKRNWSVNYAKSRGLSRCAPAVTASSK